MSNFKEYLHKIVNLTDYIDIEAASQSIRANISFKGPNVWILAFAVVIASVGLNVNSIPVIIGAMLVSPLMGPITGVGLALGTNDSRMLKDSLRNLLVMVMISILASSLYFVLSPLKMENPSELLARTNPTIFDVMIALFGGFAGIVETTKKEKGTVLAGVAIATALMPPLCTVGFGIASLNINYIIGALYLFFINSVFIALATYFFVRYLKFPTVKYSDAVKQKRIIRNITIVTIILIVPSILSAITVIKENTFSQNAKRFIVENKSINRSYIYDYKIHSDRRDKTIEISIAGEPLGDSEKEVLYKSLESHGINRDKLVIVDKAVTARQDISENEMVKSIFERSDEEVRKREQLLSEMDKQLRDLKAKDLPSEQIAKEMLSQYPDLTEFTITRGSDVNLESFKGEELVLVLVQWKKPKDDVTIANLEKWLSTRLNISNLRVIQDKKSLKK